jgi:DNA-binding transcriptional MerR regulator
VTTAHVQAASRQRLRSIGDVLAELRPEFPELTSSKLRFLESEGLVAPARLPNGYRKYTERHVQRLRLVLTLQRDQYLPLRVIKEKLAAFDAGEDVLRGSSQPAAIDLREDRGAAGRPAEQDPPSQEAQGDLRHRIAELAGLTFEPVDEHRTYGREELLASCGLSRSSLSEIEDARLISPLPSGRYDEDALIVASVAAQLIARGLEVRHIKPTRHTVERELGTIDSMVAIARKRRNSGDAADQQGLVDASQEIAGGFLALHAALLRSALRSSL